RTRVSAGERTALVRRLHRLLERRQSGARRPCRAIARSRLPGAHPANDHPGHACDGTMEFAAAVFVFCDSVRAAAVWAGGDPVARADGRALSLRGKQDLAGQARSYLRGDAAGCALSSGHRTSWAADRRTERTCTVLAR